VALRRNLAAAAERTLLQGTARFSVAIGRRVMVEGQAHFARHLTYVKWRRLRWSELPDALRDAGAADRVRLLLMWPRLIRIVRVLEVYYAGGEEVHRLANRRRHVRVAPDLLWPLYALPSATDAELVAPDGAELKRWRARVSLANGPGKTSDDDLALTDLEVWLDPQGLIRRLAYTQAMAPYPGHNLTIEFLEFGQPFTVPPLKRPDRPTWSKRERAAGS
jgi:hypothetical protein